MKAGYDIENIKQNQLTKNQGIQEFINTEKTYQENLKFLHDIFEEKKELVEHIEVLAKFKEILSRFIAVSELVIKNIEETLSNPDTDRRHQLIIHRGQLIKAFFEIYPQYNNLYDNFSIAMKNKPDDFKELVNYVSTPKSNRGKLSLQSFLIQPVQRGPRYLMLIDSILKQNSKLADGDKDKLQGKKLSDLEADHELARKKLEEANARTNPQQKEEPTKPGYRFGDLVVRPACNFAYQYFTQKPKEQNQSLKEEAPEAKSNSKQASSRFGLGWFNSSKENLTSTSEENKPNPQKGTLNEDDFVHISPQPSPDL